MLQNLRNGIWHLLCASMAATGWVGGLAVAVGAAYFLAAQ